MNYASDGGKATHAHAGGSWNPFVKSDYNREIGPRVSFTFRRAKNAAEHASVAPAALFHGKYKAWAEAVLEAARGPGKEGRLFRLTVGKK